MRLCVCFCCWRHVEGPQSASISRHLLHSVGDCRMQIAADEPQEATGYNLRGWAQSVDPANGWQCIPVCIIFPFLISFFFFFVSL